ncbi:unnamed protein product [Mytilus edulis]|uniref:Vwde helical domain-containing protein n=1 Tax=Mytilus edulis TaxID=6550 RepID=A0A8S3SJR1_MYTED|nr:unnamed protein product [Mytilus edulis]
MNDKTITILVVMVKEQRNFPQIDYHRTRSLIYWADSTYATIHRTCYPCDSNERQIEDILPKSSKYRPHSVAVDSEHDHIYWSERNYKAVFRSELDGTNEVEIIRSSAEIGYITLDVNNNWMYYMDNEVGTINRCTLNGKNRTTIISDAVMTMDTRILLVDFRRSISDNIIEEGWYRVYSDNGDAMPTAPPGTKYCGTTYPFWLNGSGLVKCPEGMSSETGYDPGCSSNFPTDSVSVKVKAMSIEVETVPEPNYDQTSSSVSIFKCEFEDPSNGTYGYDVYWYISGDVIKINKHLLFEDITDSISLNATEWHGKYKMNMEVKCAIRMRNSKQSTPGPYLNSPIFKAGLYPESFFYAVNEGESINITFTSSVPVGCNGSNCELIFYIRQWADTSSCTNGIVNRDILIKAEFCGISFGNSTGIEKKALQVYGYNDGLYNINNRNAYIELYTSSVSKSNTIWEDVYIEPIRVMVKDKDIALLNRLCQSYNDPHFRTFDGNTMIIWVHALFTSCGSGLPGASCLCGIAIRSKCSLFVLRTCEQISRREKHLLQQPIVSLTSCDENDMTVIHTNDDYKAVHKCGFYQTISGRHKHSKRSVWSSSTTPDQSDDFTLRGNGQVTDEQIFADSWKITAGMVEEQLFVKEPAFLKTCNDSNDRNLPVDNYENIPNFGTFCACEQQRGSSQSPNGHCNLTQINEQCSKSQSSSSAYVHYTRCSQSERRRRAVDSSNRQILSDNDDFPPLTFRYGWTSGGAYNICSQFISEALQKDMYKAYVDVPDEKFIEACVKDIEIAGDTTFLTDTINTMTTSIMSELLKTENLYMEKSSDGSQTLLEYFSSTLCKNSCGGNGICKSGVCKCDSGFIGGDCSFDISIPPTDVILPLNGACKLRSRSCKTTNIFGEFFSTSVWCKRRHFEILQNDVRYTSDEDIVLATYRNSFMITMDIPASRKKRSTDTAVLSDGYDINVMMIVIPITVSVVVIVVIVGIVCFKLKAKVLRKKNASYKEEPDQKETPSNNCKQQHSTSRIDFQFAEEKDEDVVAEQNTTQKKMIYRKEVLKK